MSEPMQARFQIVIGFDDNEKMYHATIYSAGDAQAAPVKNPSMRRLMARITKLVRDKNAEVKHFPLPEEKLIIAPGNNGDIDLIVPAHN